MKIDFLFFPRSYWCFSVSGVDVKLIDPFVLNVKHFVLAFNNF